ncbi:MAG: hypothetical protein EAX96_05135 [Candidatus Lokiarchaeota archaeon]|nr:hypothetical protein [Candidatus Lokiarchaeota archaeon]
MVITLKNDDSNDEKYDPKNIQLSRSQWILLAVFGAISGGAVGQIIDNAYPMSGALHYHNAILVPFFGQVLEFVWFVPILYITAGALIAILITLLSKLFNRETGTVLDGWIRRKPRGGNNPSWIFTISSILIFVLQWFLGCHLSIFVPNAWLFAILVLWGLLIWWIFDGTDAGLILCLMVAALGPLIEFTLINVFGFYHYTNPDMFGVPFWFVGHYIGGTPGNMNLARKYLAFLHDRGTKNN